MKSLRGILGAIRKADQLFSLINDGDKVMVGVSGGKDSMVLLYALLQYQRFSCVKFEIVPCILDLGFDEFTSKEIEEYCESIGTKLVVNNSKEVYKILKAQQKEGKHLPCSICSRMKKAAINKAAKELGCNKVAFAHHVDDAIETFFMNMIFGGRVATFQPKMHLENANIDFIRPLILVKESQVKACIKENNIPVFSSHCPNEGITTRSEMKDMLDEMYKKYPSSKDNFVNMLMNYEYEQLFYSDFFYKLEGSKYSIKPVISAKDSLIEQQLRDKLNLKNLDDELTRFIIYKDKEPVGVFSYINKDNDYLIDSLKIKNQGKTFTAKFLKFFKDNMLHYVPEANVILK